MTAAPLPPAPPSRASHGPSSHAPAPSTPTMAIVSGGAGLTALIVGILLLHGNQAEISAFLRATPLAQDAGLVAWLRHLAPVADHVGWAIVGAALVGLVGWLSPRWHARYAPRPVQRDANARR